MESEIGRGARLEINSIVSEYDLRGLGARTSARISVGGLNDEQSHWLKKFMLATAIGVPINPEEQEG